jgi:twinkle protein
MGESEFLHHEPCPECGSSDNLARYDDGHAHCFTQGCDYFEKADGETPAKSKTKKTSGTVDFKLIDRTLRGITPETFRHWRYGITKVKGKACHVANHVKVGKVVGQKLRYRDKSFAVRGELEPLYGMWLWGASKKVVVTEGEIDALSVSQVQDHKWPVVSVSNGAAGAAKSVGKAVDWLDQFDEVIFMFDMDEPGQEAAEECASILPPGKAKIATLPAQDANELLQQGRGEEIIRAIWNAKAWRPDGIVSMRDVIADALKPPEWGLDTAWPTLTDLMYGERRGEWYALGAGVGVGKTDVLAQMIAFKVKTLGLPVASLSLEQPNPESAVRLAGKIDGRLYHVPRDPDDPPPDLEQMEATMRSIADKVYFYDHFGSTEWDRIKELLRYLRHGCGVRDIFLDHLTALAAHAEDERRYLDKVCAELSSLCQELGLTMWVVSHLTTPKGESHEEGGRVKEKHFTGSRAIARWSHFMFGLERDKQETDPAKKNITTFRCLKDRYTGRGTGQTFGLKYDEDTGILHETSLAVFDGDEGDDEECPF